MNKALGLHWSKVRPEHVDAVVRFDGADVLDEMRPTRLTGKSLHTAMSDQPAVADRMLAVDLEKPAPSMGLVVVGRLEQVGRGVEAANTARFLRMANEPK